MVAAPAANAATTTIYPNYSNGWCNKGGTVAMVQVAAIPGGSTNWRNGNWTSVSAPANQNVRIIGNVYCSRPFYQGGGYYRYDINRTIYTRPNTSYYF
jgi:hypothetical protein